MKWELVMMVVAYFSAIAALFGGAFFDSSLLFVTAIFLFMEYQTTYLDIRIDRVRRK